MKVIEFGPEDKKVIRRGVQERARGGLGEDIDKRGKPGSEVFKAFTEALAASH